MVAWSHFASSFRQSCYFWVRGQSQGGRRGNESGSRATHCTSGQPCQLTLYINIKSLLLKSEMLWPKSWSQVHFLSKGWSSSGIKLDGLEISGVDYTSFKGSRYATESGCVELRLPSGKAVVNKSMAAWTRIVVLRLTKSYNYLVSFDEHCFRHFIRQLKGFFGP